VDGCDDAGLPRTGPIPMYRRFVDGRWFWPAMFCILPPVSYTCSRPHAHVIGAKISRKQRAPRSASLARASLSRPPWPAHCSQNRREGERTRSLPLRPLSGQLSRPPIACSDLDRLTALSLPWQRFSSRSIFLSSYLSHVVCCHHHRHHQLHHHHYHSHLHPLPLPLALVHPPTTTPASDTLTRRSYPPLDSPPVSSQLPFMIASALVY
jgi:hypothetical protein